MQITGELLWGIINWYPFESGASIYFAGECAEALKQDLLERGLASQSDADGKYDYVLAYLLLEKSSNQTEQLKKLKSLLKPEGHLFLACENRYALKYFIGDYDPFTDKVFDGIEGYGRFTSMDFLANGGRCYSRSELLEFIDAAGFSNVRGYSVLPGLCMPQQMYAWDTLPKEKLQIRYTPYYNHPSSVFMYEAALYDGVIKNDMFHQMANAYLIDCTISGCFYDVDSVTTSMDRGRKSATATIIEKSGYVVKKALYPEGNAGIEQLVINTEKLKEHGIQVVALDIGSIFKNTAPSVDNDNNNNDLGFCNMQKNTAKSVTMPYIDAKTALEYFREIVFKDKGEFIKRVEEFLELILKSSEPSEIQNSELGICYKEAYIDMVPLNCFFVNGEFVFFDQEFVVKDYPVSIPMVRAIDIIYSGDSRMQSIVPDTYFFEKYGLNKKINAIRAAGHNFINKLRRRSELLEYNNAHMADYQSIADNRQRMNFSSAEYERLYLTPLADTENKKVYLFGSGNWGKAFIRNFRNRINIEAIVDNNMDNHGKCINDIRICAADELLNCGVDKVKVIVCIKNYPPVVRQLKAMGITNYCLYNPSIELPESSLGYKADESFLKEISLLNLKPSGAYEDKEAGEAANTGNVVGAKPKIGYVAGVFDLFHMGHLNILRRAKEHCDYLLVGVVSDEQASRNKNRSPYVNENERCEIVAACRYVDKAFVLPIDESGTRDVFRKYPFDVQFSGSDYEHDESWLKEQKWLRERGADLVFFPYTKSVSSTKLKSKIEDR